MHARIGSEHGTKSPDQLRHHHPRPSVAANRSRHEAVLELQRSAGNRAVASLLSGAPVPVRGAPPSVQRWLGFGRIDKPQQVANLGQHRKNAPVKLTENRLDDEPTELPEHVLNDEPVELKQNRLEEGGAPEKDRRPAWFLPTLERLETTKIGGISNLDGALAPEASGQNRTVALWSRFSSAAKQLHSETSGATLSDQHYANLLGFYVGITSGTSTGRMQARTNALRSKFRIVRGATRAAGKIRGRFFKAKKERLYRNLPPAYQIGGRALFDLADSIRAGRERLAEGKIASTAGMRNPYLDRLIGETLGMESAKAVISTGASLAHYGYQSAGSFNTAVRRIVEMCAFQRRDSTLVELENRLLREESRLLSLDESGGNEDTRQEGLEEFKNRLEEERLEQRNQNNNAGQQVDEDSDEDFDEDFELRGRKN